MNIGFTGTRQGLTEPQKERLWSTLQSLQKDGAVFFCHGDCIGADSAAHLMASILGLRIILHPPDRDALRAFCEADEVRKPLPYLQRNHAIVDETDVLLACPGGRREELRSGTWATVRFARKQGKRVILIYPDGDTEEKQA